MAQLDKNVPFACHEWPLKRDYSRDEIRETPRREAGTGRTYTGQWLGDWGSGCPHGFGTMEQKSGASYDGYFLYGKMHGMGRWFYNNGEVFYGNWKGNDPFVGLYLYRNGDMFNGEWRDEKPHGKGTQKYKNGEVMQGFWNSGKFAGIANVPK